MSNLRKAVLKHYIVPVCPRLEGGEKTEIKVSGEVMTVTMT